MALSITHATVVVAADDGTSEVGSDEWNAAHTLSGLGAGVETFLQTPSSANLASAVTDETGTGALVFANTPTLVTPVLGVATFTSLTGSGATVTTSTPILNLTQTWNAGAVAFTGIKLVITDTASAATSKYIDLIQGPSTSVFSVDKGGTVYCPWGLDVGTGAFVVTSGGQTTWTASAILSWSGRVAFGSPAAGKFAIANSTTAQGLFVYNTSDASASGTPTNYERAVFDWTTTANTLTIGAQAGGTGTVRSVNFVGGVPYTWYNAAGGQIMQLQQGANYMLQLPSGFNIGWSDLALARAAAGVASFAASNSTVPTKWFQWGGQKRVTADFDTGNSTTLADITGLSVSVAASRHYSFEAVLPTTSDVAAGVKFAIGGTATATSITYEAIVYSGGAVVAQTRAAALAGEVGAITAVTAAYVRITGLITVNAAGTLTVQMAQNVGNATGSKALRGSYFIVHDMP